MIGQGHIFGVIPISVVIMFAVLILSYIILNKTCFGRKVYAVGGNRTAAIASGIDADKVIRTVYVYDGIMTAIAAIIFMSRLSSGQPSAGVGYAFDAITAVVVGAYPSTAEPKCHGNYSRSGHRRNLNNLMNLKNVTSYWQDIIPA